MDKQRHDIEKYLSGKLTPSEMYALEKQALEDPFLAEALEGTEHINPSVFSEDIAELNAKLLKRKTPAWTWPVRIAASLLLLLIAAFIIWTMPDNSMKENLALEETLVTEDSLSNATSQTQAPQTETAKSSPLSESKKENELTSARQPAHRSKKIPAETTTEAKRETSKEKQDTRVRSIPRKKRLEEESEVTKIDPNKKNELQSPSAQDIKLAEGFISAVDARPTTIAGMVMSAEDGTPLRDVRVSFKGTSVATKTDINGMYSLSGYSKNKTLVYSSEGLESTEVKIQGIDSTYLPVKLEITEEAQREAVVESTDMYGYPTDVSTIPAHPEKGNRAFKQYLQRNYKYPDEAIVKRIEGVVVIEFKVDASGSLSEFKIVRGIGTGCDEEVIRLILQGVKWIPATRGGIPVTDKARVRFKFELD